MRSNVKQQKPARTKYQTRPKAECELGKTCPYQHEHQHIQEFSHNTVPKTVDKRKFNEFINDGHKLGGNMSIGNQSIGYSHGDMYDKRVWEGQSALEDSSTYCELCKKMVQLSDVENHTKEHEMTRQRDNLKINQDEEYEASLIKDSLKFSNSSSSISSTTDRLAKEENKALEEAINNSILSSYQDDREKALAAIEPEPDGENYKKKIVEIKFRLPSGLKLTRNFRGSNSIQDALIFLRGQEELMGKSWNLHFPMDKKLTISHFETKTFEELNIDNKTMLIVQISSDPISMPTIGDKIEIVNKKRKIENQSSTKENKKKRVVIDLT